MLRIFKQLHDLSFAVSKSADARGMRPRQARRRRRALLLLQRCRAMSMYESEIPGGSEPSAPPPGGAPVEPGAPPPADDVPDYGVRWSPQHTTFFCQASCEEAGCSSSTPWKQLEEGAGSPPAPAASLSLHAPSPRATGR